MASPRGAQDYLIHGLQLAATKIGIEASSVTWSSVSTGVVAAAAAATVLLTLVYHRPGKRELSSQKPKSSPEPKSKKMQQVAIPKDGTVKVAQIFVHPIKSCRGVSVQTARFNPQGLEFDRRWCVIDVNNRSLVTAREWPRMVLIIPEIEFDPTSPHKGAIVFNFPPDSPAGCVSFRIPLDPTMDHLKHWTVIDKLSLFGDPCFDGYVGHSLPLPSSYTPEVLAAPTPSSILSIYFGKPVHLCFKGPSDRVVDKTVNFPDLHATSVFQDMYPLMVLSKESMSEVELHTRARLGQQGVDEAIWKDGKVEIRRFRPNIVFEGGGPFAEDHWEEVKIGSTTAPTISLVSKCVRCLLPNVSPETGERDKAVPYKVLMKFRIHLDPIEKLKPCVGSNGVPEKDGVISVGDVVYVRKLAPIDNIEA